MGVRDRWASTWELNNNTMKGILIIIMMMVGYWLCAHEQAPVHQSEQVLTLDASR
ncbi:hypothetical protein SAMN04488028_103375 [Reichenbachiella agariperforans]|uniref:Uncharacterized protein n=1 Tax=Reichenbachiella agariperforans TaxID=156994 RepID=A0A1M6QLQ0_REIAG|nr:hypothetical protein SAMN04488028_103375 [Reichenbachiella agariperforans]